MDEWTDRQDENNTSTHPHPPSSPNVLSKQRRKRTLNPTRTTRTPTFWDTHRRPWLPILVIDMRSHVIKRQSQSYKFQKFAKNSNFEILQWPVHVTHLLKLLDKMCKYEMDLTSIVEDTEQTRFCRTDGWTDGQTDGQRETNIPPFQLRWRGW